MDLTKIISISGKPGLFKLIAQTKGGFIVEDIEKEKKTSISSRSNVSLLENIAIYGLSEEYPLKDVFMKIYEKENGGTAINHKEAAGELRKYMAEVLPDYDESRVHDSDLKKLFQWYNLLHSKGLAKPEPEEKEEETTEASEKPLNSET